MVNTIRLKTLAATSLVVFSTFTADARQSEKAFEPEHRWTQRSMTAAGEVYSYVAEGATELARPHIEATVEGYAKQIGKEAAGKLHSALYRFHHCHVVDNSGQHIGYVESYSPTLLRETARRFFGFDPEQDIPGVPVAVSRFATNYLERWLGDYLEQHFAEGVETFVQEGSLFAIRQAFGMLSNNGARTPSLQARVSEEQIRLSLKKAAADGALQDVEDQDALTRFLADSLDSFKLWLEAQIQETITATADHWIQHIADETGEKAMGYAEKTTIGALTTAAYACTGPIGGFVTAFVAFFDQPVYTTRQAAHSKSSIRRAIEWCTGFELRKSRLVSMFQTKAFNVARSATHSLGLLSEERRDQLSCPTIHTDENGGEWVVLKDPNIAPSLSNVWGGFKSKAQAAASTAASVAAGVHEANMEMVDLYGGVADTPESEDFVDHTNPFPTLKKVGGWLGRTLFGRGK